MRAKRFLVTCGALSLVAMACTAGSAGPGNAGCPSAQPSAGNSCSPLQLSCSYGCAATAICTASGWSIAESNVACVGDSGVAPGIEGGRLPDGALTCVSQKDCPSDLECSAGGEPSGCGICATPQYPCSVDQDCATINDAAPPAPMVCGPVGACTCPVDGKSGSCIPACTSDSECGDDESCATSGHCVAKACTQDSDCPSTQAVDFACSASGTCAEKPCVTDSDCGAHFCVNAICYPEQGVCVGPAA